MIFIGSDHKGYKAKEYIQSALLTGCHKVVDRGPHSIDEKINYPNITQRVCQYMNPDEDLAILIGDTGIGMSLAANKYPGIRAVCAYDMYSAKAAKKHFNANVLCIGTRETDNEDLLSLVHMWMTTDHDFDKNMIDLILTDTLPKTRRM